MANDDRPTDDERDGDGSGDRPRKGVHPLFWLLILLALLALGWSFYNQYAGRISPAPVRTGTTPRPG